VNLFRIAGLRAENQTRYLQDRQQEYLSSCGKTPMTFLACDFGLINLKFSIYVLCLHLLYMIHMSSRDPCLRLLGSSSLKCHSCIHCLQTYIFNLALTIKAYVCREWKLRCIFNFGIRFMRMFRFTLRLLLPR
jgi:hypothetical protein